jgi:hypothetical protein
VRGGDGVAAGFGCYLGGSRGSVSRGWLSALVLAVVVVVVIIVAVVAVAAVIIVITVILVAVVVPVLGCCGLGRSSSGVWLGGGDLCGRGLCGRGLCGGGLCRGRCTVAAGDSSTDSAARLTVLGYRFTRLFFPCKKTASQTREQNVRAEDGNKSHRMWCRACSRTQLPAAMMRGGLTRW